MDAVAAMESCSVGATQLEVMETYKVALPSALHCTGIDSTITFCSNNSRPVTCSGLPKDRCNELLGSLLNCLFSNFRACVSPEEYLARADGTKTSSKNNNEQKVVLVGASNLGHSVPHFAGSESEIVTVIKPGWIATSENVAVLAGTVKNLAPTASAFVFDLFGNSSIRFEQVDGTTALPFRSNGKYHLGGNVVTTPADIFKRVVENVLPVIKEKGTKPCVIIPPLPRYVFARCCSNAEHCTNMNNKGYQENLMSGFIQLRTSLIKLLVSHGITNFKVMDACCPTNCSLTASVGERIVELKKVTAKDGVHFIDAGYKKLAERCSACISVLLAGEDKPCKRKPTFHFWRGFRSHRGSMMPMLGSSERAARGSNRGLARGSFRSGGRNRAFHPYRRW
jgi:hypothetical protein